MYDGEGQPGRNDECWCGSGKKYKKCHWQTDERLQELYDKGYEVPTRDILKGPADIEAIKASAAVNVGVLDMVAERIAPGVSTEEIDQWIYDYTIAARRPTWDTAASRKACARPSTTLFATAFPAKRTC